jgi:hypothetical protein
LFKILKETTSTAFVFPVGTVFADHLIVCAED